MELFEKTLGIIGSGLVSRTADVEEAIRNSGLVILQVQRFLLRSDQAAQFLSISHFQKEEPPGSDDDDDEQDRKGFIDSMTGGPIDVLIIGGFEAVSRWLDLIGQLDFEMPPDYISAQVYGSRDVRSAGREIRFFFPETKFEIDLGFGSSRQYLSEVVSPILVKGLVSLSREKPEIPVLWLAQWLLDNRPHEC